MNSNAISFVFRVSIDPRLRSCQETRISRWIDTKHSTGTNHTKQTRSILHQIQGTKGATTIPASSIASPCTNPIVRTNPIGIRRSIVPNSISTTQAITSLWSSSLNSYDQPNIIHSIFVIRSQHFVWQKKITQSVYSLGRMRKRKKK